MKNKERIQILEIKLNIQSKILEKITTLLEIDNEQVKLKKLDQSIFNGLDEKWRYAVISLGGKAIVTSCEPKIVSTGYYCEDGYVLLGTGYDSTNWQRSLIERETIELTGNDLCKAMLKRGDKIVLCIVRNIDEDSTYYDVITHYSDDFFESSLSSWSYATPVNNQGEPLTSLDVGL